MKHTILKRLLPMLLIVWLALSGCEADDPWEETFYHSDLYVAGTNITANLTSLSANATAHNASQTVSHNLTGLLALKANLASPTFTGTSTFPSIAMTGDLNINSNYFRNFVGLTTAAGVNSVFGWNGGSGWTLYTPNSGDTSGVLRFELTGTTNTAVARWSNTTQTWSSYGAGTLVTDANGVVTASSDARLKTVVGSFSRGLKAILALSPVEFRWKSTGTINSSSNISVNDDKNIYVGLLAQDVMKYIPEAVGQAPDGNYTLSDRALIAALVNSVKELQAQIDALNVQLKNRAYDRTLAPIIDDTKVIKSVR